MLLEPIELTINHIDLGNLNEFALTTLFGAAQAYHITAGRGLSIRDIVDRDGNVLYPGYYMTHLRVSPTRLVDSFEPWKPLSVGVEHRIFGGMIMDSTYVLGRQGELEQDSSKWALDRLPSMRGGTIFVLDNNDAVHQPKTPQADKIA